MRKRLFVLLFIMILVLSGCSSEKPLLSESGTDTDTGNLILVTEQDQTDSTTGSTTFDETETTEQGTTEESAAETTTAVTSQKETDTTASEKEKSSTDKKDTPDNTEETKDKESEDKTPVSTEPEKPKPEETKPSVTETPPAEPNATAADTAAISNLVAKYINEYRTEQGIASATKLPGLTSYAQRRSVQIISDFSHNTLDERAAATAMSYGKYIDPSLYGMDGEPYYTACAGEAIAKAGYVGTVDYVAKSLAKLIRNSPEHWAYIGASDYQFIGVGITYESGLWYCDVALTRENFG